MKLHGGPDGPEASTWMRAATMTYFMGSSMLVQFTTKAVFTIYGFQFPLTVALLQMLCIVPVAWFVARPELSWQLARALVPLAMVNACNVVAGLVGTAGLNVPMFIALRRFTLLLTIFLERFWLRKTHDWPTVAATATMIGGALLAAVSDLTFNPVGYAAVLLNDALTSLYLILVKGTPASSGLTTTGMLFYNSALSLPPLALAAWARGELAAAAAFPLLASPRFQAALTIASALGLTINHSTLLCTRVNEPLATSVAGNLKNVLMTLVGTVAFGDFVYDPLNALGLAASMAGAVWYATRSAFKARQRALKSSLLSQVPVIGRDRLRGRAGSGGEPGAWPHHRAAHTRTGSSANVSTLLQLAAAGEARNPSGNLGAAVSAALGAVAEEGAAEALAPGPAHAARALELRDAELGAADTVITPRRDR
ncbi:hypothetical protein QBZ16_000047 [Prototheca wickerhamii]|uniref:Sugar phosphate transporter domain-containing protein n=1 Tax=Prototheca wickerhamii TaxID=3111 RepID=A0AAD9IKF9_PROWI|nr:hypothetical protein QBZ16_000047 [Prototheca wickerhamii]